jgi:hypothetical protein
MTDIMAGMIGILWGHKTSEGTRVITLEIDRMRIVSQRKFHSWSPSTKGALEDLTKDFNDDVTGH